MRKNAVVFALVLFCFLSGCEGTTIVEGYVPILDPHKDDKTTVRVTGPCKFHGFWSVTNLELDWWDGTPVPTDRVRLYNFKKDQVLEFEGIRNDDGSYKLESIGAMRQFMYSDTSIYTLVSHDEWKNEWIKSAHELSADGKNLKYGGMHRYTKGEKIEFVPWTLEKIELEPSWTKEDILGTWYDGDLEGLYTTYTFSLEDDFFDIYLLVQQLYEKGHPYKDIYFDDYSISTKMELTDEDIVFGKYLNSSGSSLESSRMTGMWFYYLFDGRLFLSTSFYSDGRSCLILNRLTE